MTTVEEVRAAQEARDSIRRSAEGLAQERQKLVARLREVDQAIEDRRDEYARANLVFLRLRDILDQQRRAYHGPEGYAARKRLGIY